MRYRTRSNLCKLTHNARRIGLLHASAVKRAAEKGGFVGRGFSHDVSAMESLGVLTPEARNRDFSIACLAVLIP